MDAIPFDHRLSEQVTGRVFIPTATFQKKLGATTYLVWQLLCAHRDANGMTTITYNGMVTSKRFQNVTRKQIKGSLKRLRLAKLVVDFGPRRRRMVRPCRKSKTGQAEVWAMPRRVFGARCFGSRGNGILIPGWSWSAIQKLPTWGGQRRNAGRLSKNQEVPTEQEPLDALRHNNQEVPTDKESRGPTDIYTTSVLQLPIELDELQLPSEAATHEPPRGLSAGTLLMQQSSTPVQEDTSNGTRIGGVPKRSPPAPGMGGVPPYPDASVIPPAMVPRPPQLPDGLSRADEAWWLAIAYRGAVESRTGKKSWVLATRSKLEGSKHYPMLLDAARMFRDLEIAPAAWAAFSVDAWYKFNRGKTTPPLKWVYSEKWISEKQGWFRSEASSYSGRRAVFCQAAQSMMRRYQRMLIDLARAGAQTRGEVAAVVERHFPGDTYQLLSAKAKVRAASDQEKINALAAKGEWLKW